MVVFVLLRLNDRLLEVLLFPGTATVPNTLHVLEGC